MAIIQTPKLKISLDKESLKESLKVAFMFLLRNPNHEGINDPRLLSSDENEQWAWTAVIEEMQDCGLLKR